MPYVYSIEIKKKAQKALRKMPAKQRELIARKIREYAENPEDGRGVIRMQGVDSYRMRIGDWRVIFEKRDDVLVILVLDVGSRGGIYK